MDENGQAMPSFDALCNIIYKPAQWLTYYRNIWQRNMMGSMVDVMHDGGKPGADFTADNIVDDFGRALVDEKSGDILKKTFAVRLEERKANVKRCAGVIAAIDALLALSEEELTAKMAVDGDFLKAIVPAAPAEAEETKLVSFTVLPGQQLTGPDAKVYGENTTVDLDPEAPDTKEALAANKIKPTEAQV